MPEDFKQNISIDTLEYIHISLISSKIKVLVVGGGRAGFIKSRSLAVKGCEVTVISPDFCKEFEELKMFNNLKCINDKYCIDYIEDKQLIVIAVGQQQLVENIVEDCIKEHKLFLNCSDFTHGNFIMPAQGRTENIFFSVNTLGGNPKVSMFIKRKTEETLREYDELVDFSTQLRPRIKESPYKNEIMDFVASEDFIFFIKKGVQNTILNIFYGGNNFEFKNSHQAEQTSFGAD